MKPSPYFVVAMIVISILLFSVYVVTEEPEAPKVENPLQNGKEWVRCFKAINAQSEPPCKKVTVIVATEKYVTYADGKLDSHTVKKKHFLEFYKPFK